MSEQSVRSWQKLFLRAVGAAALLSIAACVSLWSLTADPANAAGALTQIQIKFNDTRFTSSSIPIVYFYNATAITTSTGSCTVDPCGAIDLIFPRDSGTGIPAFNLEAAAALVEQLTVGGVTFTVNSSTVTTTNAYASATSTKDMVKVMFDLNGQTIGAGSLFVVDFNHAGTKNIFNPYQTGTPGSGVYEGYTFTVNTLSGNTSTVLDTGITKTAFGEGTFLNADVNETFTFKVGPMLTSDLFGGDPTNKPSVNSTSSTCPFGTLQPDTPKICGQTLTLNTNSPNGYTVYVHQDTNMLSGTNDINEFYNGIGVHCGGAGAWSYSTCVWDAVTWMSPSGTPGSAATYGHLGYSSDDMDVFTTSTSFVSINYGTGYYYYSSPIMTAWVGSGADDVVHAKFQIEVSFLQEAGTYTNNIWYVAVPSY